MRVLLAGLFHETHTFLEETTAEFSTICGDELLACEGDGSPLAGVLAVARQRNWQIVPSVDCRAQPSGTAAHEVFERFWSQLANDVRRAVATGLDAIYLVLHGAMVTTQCRDVEGELLARLRALPGVADLPIFGVFDLHANFTPAMAQHADCLVAYRENPHADAYEAATRAADLLDYCWRQGVRLRTFWRHSGIIWPPTGTGTADSPMRDLAALARHIEASDPQVLVANVIGGFAYADIPETGASFSLVTTGDEASAARHLRQLCELAWELRETGNKLDPPLARVLDELRTSLPGLTVIAEPSDNIGGGAPGDGTGLLRALVTHNIQNAAVCLCDAAAVAALQSVPLGGRATLPLGGRGSRLDEGPLTLEVELVSRSDRRFALEDRQSHLASLSGDHFDMGPCAVVKHGGITLLLTSRKTPPFDLGQWRSQGIHPEQLAVIVVKAAVAHRRAYDPIAARMRWADTPGPCRSDVRLIPYQHVRRPVYPLSTE